MESESQIQYKVQKYLMVLLSRLLKVYTKFIYIKA